MNLFHSITLSSADWLKIFTILCYLEVLLCFLLYYTIEHEKRSERSKIEERYQDPAAVRARRLARTQQQKQNKSVARINKIFRYFKSWKRE